MSDRLIKSETLTDIADAIRERTETTEKINPRDFASHIRTLEVIEEYDEAVTVDGGANVVFTDDYTEGYEDGFEAGKSEGGGSGSGSGGLIDVSKLESVTILDSVPKIEASAFSQFTALKTVIFGGTPQSISATAFEGCVALTRIFVPWSNELVVADAPWGSNATVYYYSETKPNTEGWYWYYVDGKISIWAPVYKETEGLAFISPGAGYYPICIGIGTATDDSIIVIPESALGGDPVKEIGVAAFADVPNVTTVVLPPYLEAAYGGSLSSPSIKKVVVKKHPDGAHDNSYFSGVYSWMFTSPNNSLYYSDTQYINDGASAFCPVVLEDVSGGSWSQVYVGRGGSNTTLEELHVPWSENHEWMNANRPWGLENATIIYESEESLS